MATFTDLQGRAWRVELTVLDVERIEDELGLNIAKKADLDRIFGSARTCLQVLWVVLEEQAAKHQLTDRNFKKSLDVDVLNRAMDCLAEAILIFSPRRQLAQKLVAAIRERQTAAEAVVNQRVEDLTKRIAAGELDEQLAGLSPTATDSPGSSALTPGP